MQLFSRLFAAVFAAFALLSVFANAAAIEERGRIVQIGRWSYNRGELYVPVDVRGGWGNQGGRGQVQLYYGWQGRWQQGWCRNDRRQWSCSARNVGPNSPFFVTYSDGRNSDYDPPYGNYMWTQGWGNHGQFPPPPHHGGRSDAEPAAAEKPTTA
ncbi:hypothetical protein ABW21_db0200451 [Orbilia brochopaga]|nr:hypothetical protein ABW21_db0200451 [Drechslerella brochopaga]